MKFLNYLLLFLAITTLIYTEDANKKKTHKNKKANLIVGSNNNTGQPTVTALTPDLASNSKVNPLHHMVTYILINTEHG